MLPPVTVARHSNLRSNAHPKVSQGQSDSGASQPKPRKRPVFVPIPSEMLDMKPTAAKLLRSASAEPMVGAAGNPNFSTALVLRKPDTTAFFRHGTSVIPKDALQEWITVMNNDQPRFSSAATFCEVTLSRVLAATRSSGDAPSPLRIAVVCMLLDRLAGACGPSADILRALHDELYNAIFVGWSEYRQRKSTATISAADVENDAEEYDHEGDAAFGATTSAVTVRNLQQRQTFFQALFELQEKRVEVIGRPAKVLGRVVSLWQGKIKYYFFKLWCGWVNRCIGVRRRAATYTAAKQLEKRQKSKADHFRAWRTYVFERRHHTRVLHEEGTRLKLVHRMGRHIKALEEENATLKAKYESLFEAYCGVASDITSMETLWNSFREKIKGAKDDAAPATQASAPDPATTDQHDAATPPSTTHPQSNEGGTNNASAAELAEKLHQEMRHRAEVDYLVEKADGELESVQGNAAGTVVPTGRVTQLVQFLDDVEVKHGAAPAAPDANTAEKSPGAGGRGRPKPLALAASQLGAPQEVERDDDGVIAPTNAPSVVPLDYRVVLDWVSARVQLFMTKNAVLRRCANFTVDFKDSMRLGYLLMSIGAERSLVDEIQGATTPLERAEIVCKAAEPFRLPKPLLPLDIVKAKGSAIASFLFFLYSNYNNMPLVIPTAVTAARGVAPLSAASPPRILSPSLLSTEAASPIDGGDNGVEEASPSSPAPDEAPLPDRQYVAWYRELAADDSDAEDVDEFFDPGDQRRSALDDLEARLSKRTELSRTRTAVDISRGDGSTSPSSKTRKSKAKADRIKNGLVKSEQQIAKEHLARTKVRLLRWLGDTLNPLGEPSDPEELRSLRLPGKQDAGEKVAVSAFVNPATLDNVDLINRLSETLLHDDGPHANVSADAQKAEKIKLRRIEQRLEKLHLGHVKLRAPKGAKAEDNVISLQQLVTALYVLNVKDAVVMV